MGITDITLTDVQDFIVRTVAKSSEFDTLANSLLGSSLSFHRGSDLSRDVEALPHMIGYKFNSQHIEGDDPFWIVQYIIAIDGTADPVTDGDGIVIYEATDKVEQLAVKAFDIIKAELRAGGLGGVCTIRIANVNILITEVGEADDVQAIVTLRLEEYSTL